MFIFHTIVIFANALIVTVLLQRWTKENSKVHQLIKLTVQETSFGGRVYGDLFKGMPVRIDPRFERCDAHAGGEIPTFTMGFIKPPERGCGRKTVSSVLSASSLRPATFNEIIALLLQHSKSEELKFGEEGRTPSIVFFNELAESQSRFPFDYTTYFTAQKNRLLDEGSLDLGLATAHGSQCAAPWLKPDMLAGVCVN